MKKMLLVLGLVLATSGCLTVHTSGGTQRFLLPQVGVILRVVNNCTPFLDVWGPTGILVEKLPFGEVAHVPLVSQPYTGRNRRVQATVQGYRMAGAEKEYLGSATETFSVSTYRGSLQETWEVDRLRLSNGRGGCR